MAAKEILSDIIQNFDPESFKTFFRLKNTDFAPVSQPLNHYQDKEFTDFYQIGEINFREASQRLVVIAIKILIPLSERSGKKAQYEKAKKILKELNMFDAGIFIFYDRQCNFRFSLIYPKAIGNRRQWSNFRRFTYFVSREFTNKTFLQRIGDGDFSSLEKIKDAFSVEKVTKEFYEDIANWYFWAVQHSSFPKDAEVEENGRNIAVIRLITRMIFIWFMREKSLVPKNLFEEKSISAMLKEISPESSTYYQAILQNLFFATLSTKKDDRKFRSEIRGYKGYNPDFGNQNVFRFQELFKNPENLKDDFGEIPFLNGGLFECLDDKPNGIYIDGFTDVKKNQPNVPNILFFSGEKKADLNAAYGTKSKTYKVRGLLDILSSFNFTIDENSPDDQDIALDPELLGRVFENLLASFNPETSTTARKATGSYYTPREIVDYMVAESLKAYFKTHLSAISDLDKKIEQLFSTGSEENPFDKSESRKIVELIESVRIVDPAVGSGAFPMGALNKLVFILNKVDPGNELWKQAQLSAADAIPDPRIKQDTKNRIEEFFKGKNADYGRKLYLIQKCIYGVDIQQIAVEIAKLRFFISLLVDEKIDRNHPDGNWGIEPLPNLDFKIMQGNSLLEEYEGVKLFDEKLITGSDFDKQKLIESIKQKQSDLQREYLDLHAKNKLTKIKQVELNEALERLDKQLKSFKKQDNKTEEMAELFDAQNEAKQKREALKRLHKEFFETNEKEAKDKTKKQIEKMEWDLIEVTLKEQNKTSELKKLEQFKKSNTKPFFLWKLHFADVFENGGFDIVIANPPYVSVKEIKPIDKKAFSQIFETGQGRFNLFTLFLEKGNKFLRTRGILTFILPEGLYSNVEYQYIRKYLLENSTILFINLFTDRVFDAAVDTSIISTINDKTIDGEFPVIRDLRERIAILRQGLFKELPFFLYTVNLDNDSKDIVFRILNNKTETIGDILEIQQGIIYSGQPKEKVFANEKKNEKYKKALDGRDVLKWLINWKNKRDNKFIHYTNKLHRAREERLFLAKEKILLPRKSMQICCAYDDEQYFCLNTAYVCLLRNDNYKLRFILAILNSKLINYCYSKLFFGWQITIPALDCIGIPNIPLSEQGEFVVIVDKILSITKSADYLNNSSKQAKVKEYERQIDQMVYKLYGLLEEEKRIVEEFNKG